MAKEAEKPVRSFKWWHLLIIVMVLGGVVSTFQNTAKTSDPNYKNESTASQTRSALAYAAIKAIKKTAKDPDSVKFTSLRVDEAGDVVCAEFRAKNSFGAVVPTTYTASLKNNIDSTSAKDWNKYCTAKMHDLSPLYR